MTESSPATRERDARPAITARPKVQSLNPSTGELLAEFDAATDDEVRAAVQRAREAAPAWQKLGTDGRIRCLKRLREALYARRNELAALITREAGKPLLESLVAEVMLALDTLHYVCRHARNFLTAEPVPHHNLAVKLKRGRLEYEPYGVIGIISPSNYPLSIPLGQMVPALAAGNTVVLKPSEFTPQVGLAIGQLLRAAGMGEGVATVLVGDAGTGSALVSSAVDKLIFTGSVATGKKIQARAAERLLPTVLELGGKDAMIVCADARLEVAASGAVWGAFTNAGQACLSVERLYVVRSVADEFTARVVEKTKKLRVGPGDDPSTDVGPLIRERQVALVEEHVADAVRRGARLLAGGRRLGKTSPASGNPNGGFFYEPTILTHVNHEMAVMREETFGPVLPIRVVEDEAEAVRLANDSEYGLAASVWTRDRRRGERLARALEAGSVMINDCVSSFGIAEAPHGGIKASGIGRSHSRLGLLEMARVKYIDADLVPRLPKLWWFGYDTKAVRLMQGFIDYLAAEGIAGRARGLLRAAMNFRKRRI